MRTAIRYTPVVLILLAACSPLAETGGAPDWYDHETGDRDSTGGSGDDTSPDLDSGIDDGPCTIELSETAVDFGIVDVGDSQQARIAVRNTGGELCNIEGLSANGTDAFVLGSIGSVVLPPGASTTFDITFAPNEIGTVWGQVVIESSDPDQPSQTIDLIGEGAGAQITVDPAELDFGTCDIGFTTTEVVEIQNVGNADLVITDVTVISASAEFTVFGGDDPLPWTLTPGDTRGLLVAYLPTDDFPDEAYIDIASNDPVQPEEMVAVSGVGK